VVGLGERRRRRRKDVGSFTRKKTYGQAGPFSPPAMTVPQLRVTKKPIICMPIFRDHHTTENCCRPLQKRYKICKEPYDCG